MIDNNLCGRYIAYAISLLTAAAIVVPVIYDSHCKSQSALQAPINSQESVNLRENPDSGLQLKIEGNGR